jgi:hypothetical protein
MIIKSRYLHHLAVIDGELVCTYGCKLDLTEYSQAKHGYEPPAIQYGYDLAELVADELIVMVRESGRQVTIISAPYKYLGNTSTMIASHMARALAVRFMAAGLEPPVVEPFYKSRPGSNSYALAKDEASRAKSLANMKLRINPEMVCGKIVLAVDDINVTGETQRNTANMIESLDPYAVMYLHVATIDPNTRERFTKGDRSIESELNEHATHSLDDIFRWVQSDEFVLNARILRCILEAEGREELFSFFTSIRRRLLMQMHNAVLGNGLEYTEKHTDALKVLERAISQRGLPMPRGWEARS